MPESLSEVTAELRSLLLAPDLRRAVAAGRRHGHPVPPWRRVRLRPVQVKAGRRLQEVREDGRHAHTRNHAYPAEAAEAVEDLLGLPWGNWQVDSAAGTVAVRVTKKGQAQVHRTRADGPAPAQAGAPPGAGHDRAKAHLLDPGDPLFAALGAGGAKRRQVDAFLRALVPVLPAVAGCDPLRVVDLGCGHAYLSLAAYRYLDADGRPVRMTGVDTRGEARARNLDLVARMGWSARVDFLDATIAAAPVERADLVLALHACDTATDDALAAAVRWGAPVILAAPCCHRQLAGQLRARAAPGPYDALTRHGILRQRFADVLTDALRAMLLRLLGYRAEVMEFVGTEHTGRNVLIRAVRTGAPPTPGLVAEYRELTGTWGVRPHLAARLADELTSRHGGTW